MQYEKLVLDKRSVLILPLYDKKSEIPKINIEDFYYSNYSQEVKEFIIRHLTSDLVKNGIASTKYADLGLVNLQVTVVPEEENVFDVTLLEVSVKLFGAQILAIKSNDEIQLDVRMMLVNETDLTTTLMISVNKEPVLVVPGDNLCCLGKQDSDYLKQFGDFAGQIITTHDLYDVIQSKFHHETEQACVFLTNSIADLITLMDSTIFKAFNTKKFLPAIVKTTLPSEST